MGPRDLPGDGLASQPVRHTRVPPHGLVGGEGGEAHGRATERPHFPSDLPLLKAGAQAPHPSRCVRDSPTARIYPHPVHSPAGLVSAARASPPLPPSPSPPDQQPLARGTPTSTPLPTSSAQWHTGGARFHPSPPDVHPSPPDEGRPSDPFPWSPPFRSSPTPPPPPHCSLPPRHVRSGYAGVGRRRHGGGVPAPRGAMAARAAAAAAAAADACAASSGDAPARRRGRHRGGRGGRPT